MVQMHLLEYQHIIFLLIKINIFNGLNIKHWRRKRGGGGGGGKGAHTFLIGGGGNGMFVPPPPPPPLLTPHFYFPLELYVYITLRNNYLAFFIYQLIILWTSSIK